MIIKIVAADKLSTKTLAAKDYVLTKFRVTVVESVVTDYFTYLEAETSDQARSMLDELSDEQLLKLIKSGNAQKVNSRVTTRKVLGVLMQTGRSPNDHA